MTIIEKNVTQEDSEPKSFRKLHMLLLTGSFVFLTGVIVLAIAIMIDGSNGLDFGAVIFIGPIPIVIGIGPNPVCIALCALILGVLSITLLLAFRRRVHAKEEAEENAQT